MAEESSDVAVGRRIAEMRKQKQLTQDDFLALMDASGVPWTRTILSRIEGGQRALKAAELFVAAEALGIQADDLNPRTNELPYFIQRQRAKYTNTVRRLADLSDLVHIYREGLAALLLAQELRSGRSAFIAHATPGSFVDLVAIAMDKTPEMPTVRRVLGIDEHIYKAELSQYDIGPVSLEESIGLPPGQRNSKKWRADNAIYGKLFKALYPDLQFTDAGGVFNVDGLELGIDDGR